MKALILALDGLEYNLVVRWKLKSLQQRHYGFINVNRYYVAEVEDIFNA